MAGPTSRPTPILVTYPQGAHKRNDLTAGGTGQHTFAGPVDAIIANSVGGPLPEHPNLIPCDLPVQDAATCYRNATLSMLLHLKPFLNFLWLATHGITDQNDSLLRLREISRAYWLDGRSTTQRKSDIDQPLSDWFRIISQVAQPPIVSWNVRINVTNQQGDAEEFAAYLLDRANVTLAGHFQQALNKLFRIQFVSRRAFECDCTEKQRQAFSNTEYDHWTFNVNADSRGTSLTDLIARQLYDGNRGKRGTCPSCGAQNVVYHEFSKFRFLPEIFLVSIQRYTQNRRTGAMLTDPSAHTTMPEYIDLSNVLDYPLASQGSSSNDGIYKLQSVISYSSHSGGSDGHYDVHLRHPGNTWNVVDEQAATGVTARTTLTIRRLFQPRMLAYVRVRNLEAASPFPYALPIQPSAPSTKQADNNDDDSDDVAPDASDWNATRLAQALKAKAVRVGSVKAKDKLLKIYNDFNAASADQKLDFLLKSELQRLADEANLEVDHNSSMANLKAAIIAHRQTQGSSADEASSSDTITVDTTPVDAASVVPSQATATPSHTQPASNATTNAPVSQVRLSPTQNDNVIAQLRATIAQLQAQNNALAQQVQNLTTENNRLNLVAVSNQNVSTQNVPTPANKATSGALIGDKASQHPVSTRNNSPAATRQKRILKVTAVGVARAHDGTYGNHHAYVAVPVYRADEYLSTSAWWSIDTYMHAGGSRPEQQLKRFVVHIGITRQADVGATVYRYQLELGTFPNDAPQPRLEVDMLSVGASQLLRDNQLTNVTVIRHLDSSTTEQQSQPKLADTQHSAVGSPSARTPNVSASSTPRGAYLNLGVSIEAQDQGHAASRQTFTIPLPNHNPGEELRCDVTVQPTTADGVHSRALWWIAAASDDRQVIRLGSSFGPWTNIPPAPAVQASSSPSDDSSPAVGDDSEFRQQQQQPSPQVLSVPPPSTPPQQQRQQQQQLKRNWSDGSSGSDHNDTDRHRDKRVRFDDAVTSPNQQRLGRDGDDDQASFLPDDIPSSPPIVQQPQWRPQQQRQPQQQQQQQHQRQSPVQPRGNGFSIGRWATNHPGPLPVSPRFNPAPTGPPKMGPLPGSSSGDDQSRLIGPSQPSDRSPGSFLTPAQATRGRTTTGKPQGASLFAPPGNILGVNDARRASDLTAANPDRMKTPAEVRRARIDTARRRLASAEEYRYATVLAPQRTPEPTYSSSVLTTTSLLDTTAIADTTAVVSTNNQADTQDGDPMQDITHTPTGLELPSSLGGRNLSYTEPELPPFPQTPGNDTLPSNGPQDTPMRDASQSPPRFGQNALGSSPQPVITDPSSNLVQTSALSATAWRQAQTRLFSSSSDYAKNFQKTSPDTRMSIDSSPPGGRLPMHQNLGDPLTTTTFANQDLSDPGVNNSFAGLDLGGLAATNQAALFDLSRRGPANQDPRLRVHSGFSNDNRNVYPGQGPDDFANQSQSGIGNRDQGGRRSRSPVDFVMSNPDRRARSPVDHGQHVHRDFTNGIHNVDIHQVHNNFANRGHAWQDVRNRDHNDHRLHTHRQDVYGDQGPHGFDLQGHPVGGLTNRDSRGLHIHSGHSNDSHDVYSNQGSDDFTNQGHDRHGRHGNAGFLHPAQHMNMNQSLVDPRNQVHDASFNQTPDIDMDRDDDQDTIQRRRRSTSSEFSDTMPNSPPVYTPQDANLSNQADAFLSSLSLPPAESAPARGMDAMFGSSVRSNISQMTGNTSGQNNWSTGFPLQPTPPPQQQQQPYQQQTPFRIPTHGDGISPTLAEQVLGPNYAQIMAQIQNNAAAGMRPLQTADISMGRRVLGELDPITTRHSRFDQSVPDDLVDYGDDDDEDSYSPPPP